MNYATIKSYDVASGPESTGQPVRLRLYPPLQGAVSMPRPGISTMGKPLHPEVEDQIMAYLEPWHIRGFSLLGGEPFEPANQKALLPLMRRIREKYRKRPCGATPAMTMKRTSWRDGWGPEITQDLLSCIDILVDGEFHQERKRT